VSADFSIVQGQLLPTWQRSLVNDAGDPLDLRGATVVLRVARLDGTGTSSDVPCTIVDPFGGKVAVAWRSGDTATAAVYRARFLVTYTGGATELIPPGWPMELDITLPA
jgi:hypothetical protein